MPTIAVAWFARSLVSVTYTNLVLLVRMPSKETVHVE